MIGQRGGALLGLLLPGWMGPLACGVENAWSQLRGYQTPCHAVCHLIEEALNAVGGWRAHCHFHSEYRLFVVARFLRRRLALNLVMVWSLLSLRSSVRMAITSSSVSPFLSGSVTSLLACASHGRRTSCLCPERDWFGLPSLLRRLWRTVESWPEFRPKATQRGPL